MSRLATIKSTSWRAERALFGREAADRERRSRERYMKSDEGLFLKSKSLRRIFV